MLHGFRLPLRKTLALLTAATLAASTAAAQDSFLSGAVYTMTNAAAGNEIVVYHRATDGTVTLDHSVPTGGLGTGSGLGNQSGLVLTEDERWLLAVNAGSNQISVLRVLENDLQLVDLVSSDGIGPVSLAQHDRQVFVLNAGSDSINGYCLEFDGRLEPLHGSHRLLSAAGSGAAQIGFEPDGRYLYVTEKATNVISRFRLNAAGRPMDRISLPSSGETPFGFTFGRRGQLIVTEAFGGMPNLSALSSYAVQDDGTLQTISGSVPSSETAACWAASTRDGRLIYVTNTASSSVSSYTVGFEGALTLLDAQAATTDMTPIDIALSNDGRFLYVLNATSGTITDYRIESSGALTPIAGANGGLPSSANGLAAR